MAPQAAVSPRAVAEAAIPLLAAAPFVGAVHSSGVSSGSWGRLFTQLLFIVWGRLLTRLPLLRWGQVAHTAAAPRRGAECELHAAAAPQTGAVCTGLRSLIKGVLLIQLLLLRQGRLLTWLLLLRQGSGPLRQLPLFGQQQAT